MGKEFHEKPIHRGTAQKEVLGQFADLRDVDCQRKGRLFLRGDSYPNAHDVLLLKIKGIYIK